MVKVKVDITMKKMDGDKDGRVSFADYSEMVSLCLTIVCPLTSSIHSCHDKDKDERFSFFDYSVMVSLRTLILWILFFFLSSHAVQVYFK